MNRRKFLSFFSAIFLSIYCFNALVYTILASLGIRVFGSLFRMFLYQDQHPYQFILVFSLLLALCTAVFINFFHGLKGLKKYLGIAVTFAAAFALSCAAGGLLWKIYDMQANFAPSGWQFWKDLFRGIQAGVLSGWKIALLSFPFNLIVAAGDLAAVLIFFKPSRFTLWKDFQ
jgi:hypothetical protein